MSSARNGVRARKNKERSKNFTELEKRTVLELISQHREVLRQGRSNNATNKSKQLVWSSICAEVNKRCRAECPRTPAQVKMWYENYKKKCKMRHIEPGTEEALPMTEGLLWSNIAMSQGMAESMSKDERESSMAPMIDTSNDALPLNMSSDRTEDRGAALYETDSKEALQLVMAKERPPLSASRSSGAPSPLVLLSADSPSLLVHAADLRAKILPIVAAHSSNHHYQEQQQQQQQPSNVPLNLSHLEAATTICYDTSSPRSVSPSYSNPNYPPNRHHNLPSSQIFPNKKHPKPRVFSRGGGNSQDSNNCCDRSNLSSDAAVAQSNHNNNNNNNNNNNLGNYFCSNAAAAAASSSSSPTEEEKLYYITKRQHAIFEHDLRMKTLNMELKYKEEVFSLQKQLFLIELKLKMDYLEKNCGQ